MSSHQDVLSRLRNQARQSTAATSQRFFKDKVVTFGWSTPDLDGYARELRTQLSPKQRIALAKKL